MKLAIAVTFGVALAACSKSDERLRDGRDVIRLTSPDGSMEAGVREVDISGSAMVSQWYQVFVRGLQPKQDDADVMIRRSCRTLSVQGTSMRRFLAVVLLLIAVQGCSKKDEAANLVSPGSGGAPAAGDALAQSRYLAIQNSISVEVDEQKVAPLYEAAQDACRAASVDECLVLESRISTGPHTTAASFKFRAKPGGIRKLLSTFSANGTIKSQSTTAEDLSAPIADTAKKLAMLGDYRSKLEALLERASTDVDALIKVNRELAQVQSELESMTGTQANLMRRVETEILVASIASLDSQSSWKLVTSALSEFGANLARGSSGAITGIAYLAPWALALFFVAWAGHKLWRRQRRRNRDA